MIFGYKDPLKLNLTDTRQSAERNSCDSSNGRTGILAEYDCCMVFRIDKSDPDGLSAFAKRCSRKLSYNKLDIFMYTSGGLVFVLIRANLEQLRQHAESTKLKLLVDPLYLQDYAKRGDPERDIGPINILHDETQSHIWPFAMIHMRYQRDIPEAFYWRREDMWHPFRSSIRIRLVMTMISARPPDGSHPIKIRPHIRKRNIAAFYPLHNMHRLSKLADDWLPLTVLPWKQPFVDIKEYFGEKIGFYFLFTGHYARWLVFPALAGIPIQLYMYFKNDYNTVTQMCCSPVVAVWGILMMQFWKRRERFTALEWGMTGFEDAEVHRPEYRGQLQRSASTGREELYFPSRKRNRIRLQSGVIVALLILALLAVVASIYVLNAALNSNLGNMTQVVVSLINAMQITIFNSAYQRIAYLLTLRENHKTDTQFENALVVKYFLFQFVNSYVSFFYIAFVAEHLPRDGDSEGRYKGSCGSDSCMVALAINLAVVLGAGQSSFMAASYLTDNTLCAGKGFRVVLNSTKEISKGVGIIKFAESKCREGQLDPEMDFYRGEYDPMKRSMLDYTETAIQFGYVAMFITALPVAGLGALVANVVRIKVDSWKLVAVTQRPIPRGAENIGIWDRIFNIMTEVAVVTNAGIITFTMTGLNDHGTAFRLWFFIIFQWCCFAIQALARSAVSSDPNEVRMQLERAEYFAEKILLRIPDDPALVSEDPEDVLSLHDHEDKSQRKYVVHGYDSATSLFSQQVLVDAPGQPDTTITASKSSLCPPSGAAAGGGPSDRHTEQFTDRIGSWYQSDTL